MGILKGILKETKKSAETVAAAAEQRTQKLQLQVGELKRKLTAKAGASSKHDLISGETITNATEKVNQENKRLKLEVSSLKTQLHLSKRSTLPLKAPLSQAEKKDQTTAR